MKKKVFSLALALVMCVSMSACSKDDNKDTATASEINKAKEELSSAVDKLKAYESVYAISTMMEAPDGNMSYIEVVNDLGSYTEYPVNKDGVVGKTDEDTDTSNTAYMLTDWITKDDDMYLVTTDEDSKSAVYYKAPSTYADMSKHRDVMFVDELLSKFTSIERVDDVVADIGNGEETIQMYKCSLPSDSVKSLIGLGSWGLYTSLQKDYPDNSNIQKLCEYYLKDLNMNLTFSDAKVMLGVSDGMLKYFNLEVGGLGTRMYLTKSVITGNITPRDIPDFSDAKEYVTSLQDLADYIASFDSYEDAVEAINSENTTSEASEEESSSQEESSSEDTSEESSEESSSEEPTSN